MMYRIIHNHCPECGSEATDANDCEFDDSTICYDHSCLDCGCRYRAWYDCTAKEVIRG